MGSIEIERKYLMVPFMAEKLLGEQEIEYKKERVQQYYISSPEEPYTRYRHKGDHYYRTVKRGEGIIREEREEEIDRNLFEANLTFIVGRPVDKIRYTFDYLGDTYELDIFAGTLRGLVYLEIEFDSFECAHDFILPELFLTLCYRDVSEEGMLSNYALSTTEHIVIEPYGDNPIQYFTPVRYVLQRALYDWAHEIYNVSIQMGSEPNDVEALHRFRVHMRKCRALLSIFKDYFSQTERKNLMAELAGMMQATNTKRDNDVAIITFNELKKELSGSLREAVRELLDVFMQKDQSLSSDLMIFMHSQTIEGTISSLLQIKDNPDIFGPDAATPVIFAANRVLDIQLTNIKERAGKLKTESITGKYHKLRILFKKLRYTLEILEFLADRKLYAKLSKRLKELQTVLGKIHDIDVQREDIAILVNQLQKGEKGRKLLEKMDRDQARLKEKFLDLYKEFDDRAARYSDLFFLHTF